MYTAVHKMCSRMREDVRTFLRTLNTVSHFSIHAACGHACGARGQDISDQLLNMMPDFVVCATLMSTVMYARQCGPNKVCLARTRGLGCLASFEARVDACPILLRLSPCAPAFAVGL